MSAIVPVLMIAIAGLLVWVGYLLWQLESIASKDPAPPVGGAPRKTGKR